MGEEAVKKSKNRHTVKVAGLQDAAGVRKKENKRKAYQKSVANYLTSPDFVSVGKCVSGCPKD